MPLGKISTGFLARLLNLISWSIFILILVSGGGKLSGVGINLLKPR